MKARMRLVSMYTDQQRVSIYEIIEEIKKMQDEKKTI